MEELVQPIHGKTTTRLFRLDIPRTFDCDAERERNKKTTSKLPNKPH